MPEEINYGRIDSTPLEGEALQNQELARKIADYKDLLAKGDSKLKKQDSDYELPKKFFGKFNLQDETQREVYTNLDKGNFNLDGKSVDYEMTMRVSDVNFDNEDKNRSTQYFLTKNGWFKRESTNTEIKYKEDQDGKKWRVWDYGEATKVDEDEISKIDMFVRGEMPSESENDEVYMADVDIDDPYTALRRE